MRLVQRTIITCAILASFIATLAEAYTASRVWFEFHPGGKYRVVVKYTVPELKEFRESYVEFTNRKKAEKYYWDLVKGADFFPPKADERRFIQNPKSPLPW